MNSRRWCRSLHIFIALCLHLANAATEAGDSSTADVTPTNAGPMSSVTPAPGGTEPVDSTGVSTTEVTEVPAVTAVTAGTTEAPSTTTMQPVLTPDDNPPQSLRDRPRYPALGDSYHFSPLVPTSISHSRAFYRVDDVIQTYFSSSSVRGLLHQPSPGAASAFCVSRNPAKFLRSLSLSCTRMLTPQSCTTDPNLNASSYFSNLSLIRFPIDKMAQVSDFLIGGNSQSKKTSVRENKTLYGLFQIPVTPLSEWPAPVLQNGSCVNVVKNVEYIIGYTGRGELTYASVDIVLADVDPNQLLMQTHTVQFQLTTPSSTPGRSTPAVGLKFGSPVIGRFEGYVATLTTMRVSKSGVCSSDSSSQAPILFTHNTITGCMFRSPSRDCAQLQSQMYAILQGFGIPDEVAMDSGSQLNWTRVIAQKCPDSPEGTCEPGCLLPTSLSIQVLWARQGLVDLPQSYILGAKYRFKCQNVKCPMSSPLALTTQVTFADITVYPAHPRSLPQPDWKFPFGFFSRGTAELDGHIVINSSDTEKVTWSLMLFTVMLLTGLEFFTM
ncbi:hypothetical protein INR49_013645 [Caranx melampygus]|nr:hypothetical protein INR49_013645 [Caranx melampygus]